MFSFHAVAFFCVAIVSTLAKHAIVQYANDGAVLVQTGTVELNGPDPMKIVIKDVEKCIGKIRMCYKSSDDLPAQKDCDAGYCPFSINPSTRRSTVATAHITGNAVEFTLDTSINKYCAPDFTNGVHTYRIAELPTECHVIVAGATDPDFADATASTAEMAVNETTTSSSPIMSTAVIWGIGAGGVVVILVILVVIGITIYMFVIRPRRAQQPTRRRSRSRSAGAGTAQPLLPTQTTSVTAPPKTTANDTEEKPAPPSVVTPPPMPEPVEKKKKLTTEELVPYADTVLCTFQRLDHIDPEIQKTVAEHWNINVIHDVSKLEKTVLRAPADEAMEALNQLTAELDIGLIKNKAKYGRNDTTDEVWEYANFIGIPASACYRLFAMSYPDVFKGIEDRLDDPIIAKLSIPGLYVCLMYDGFDQIFKKKLIIEMRARAVKLLEHVSARELAMSAFPIYYLAKRYKMDKKKFIEGSNVEDSRRSSRRSRRSSVRR